MFCLYIKFKFQEIIALDKDLSQKSVIKLKQYNEKYTLISNFEH